MGGKKVGVVGATGHTGHFVSRELARSGMAARWIGRDRNRLAALQSSLAWGEVQVASLADHDVLVDAFAGLDVVINCAGPFLDTARPVIAAALDAGCHVLDIAAEQAAVLDTIDRFDVAATEAGLLVVPAMAFFGGLADLLATSITRDWSHIDAIEVAVALDGWRPTAGTRVTGRRNTAPRLIVCDRALIPVPVPAPVTDWRFGDPFGAQAMTCVPLSEIVLLSRHLRVDAITSYMNARPLSDLADPSTPPPLADDASGRSAQRFAVAVRSWREGACREITAEGRDIYAVTAPLIVEACRRVLDGDTRVPGGVRSPGDVFDAADFLATLSGELSIRSEMAAA